jgi:hypothetical protein
MGLLAWVGSASAQLGAPEFPPALNTEQNALRNVSSGALRDRSPGNMVSAGVSRTLTAADSGRGIIEITEPAPEADPKAVFLSDVVQEIFAQLNRALLVLENVLRLRAGLEPRVPIDLSNLGGTSQTGDLSDLLGGAKTGD